MEKIQETIIFKEEIDEDYRNDYSQTIEADLVRDIKRLSLPVKLRIFLSEDNSYILLIDPSVKYHGIRNGNKLLVKVKSVDELVYLTEKIILNIEKCKLEQSEVCIDSEKSEDLSFKKFFKPKDPSLAKRTLSKELDFILTKPDEILIDDKKLEPYRVVADELVDKANISKDSSKKVVDFNKNVSYDRYTQDILIHHILGKNIKLSEEQKEAIKQYKTSSEMINSILMGVPDRVEAGYSEDAILKSCKNIIHLNRLFNSFPKLKHDLVLYRGGSATGKRAQKDATNKYSNVVSFTTSIESADNFAKSSQGNSDNPILYRYTIESGKNMISLDSIPQFGYAGNKTESEVLLPPFSYKVKDIEQMQINNSTNPRSFIEMGNLEYMDIPTVLSDSLLKIKKWIQVREEEIKKAENSVSTIGTEKEREKLERLGYDQSTILEEQIDLRDIIALLKEKDEFNDYRERDNEVLLDNLQYQSDCHGVNHTRRALFMAKTLAVLGNLDFFEEEILLTAIKYHDIGRENDYEDTGHGKKSVDKISQHLDKLNKFDNSDQELIFFLIEQHSQSKKENEQAIMKLPPEKKEFYKKMLDYMKDADKLDRIRLGKFDGLNPSRLSLPISQKLIKAAYQSHEYLFDLLQLEKKEKIQNMCSEVDMGIKFVEESKEQNFEVIETESITYPDDLTPALKDNTEFLLTNAIEEGKTYIRLSNLNQIGKSLRNKLTKFLGKNIDNSTRGDDDNSR